jgi:hypothetical protein
MPKLKGQMKPKVQMTKLIKKEILTFSRFGIHLTFGL